MKPRNIRPVRQWVIDSDDPYIARTLEEAHLYFKRKRLEAGARFRLFAPILSALIAKSRLLDQKGHLDS